MLITHILWRLVSFAGLVAVTMWLTHTLQDSPVAQCGIVRVDMMLRNAGFMTVFWIFVMFAESRYFLAHQQTAKYNVNRILMAIATLMVLVLVAVVYIPALYSIVYGWFF